MSREIDKKDKIAPSDDWRAKTIAVKKKLVKKYPHKYSMTMCLAKLSNRRGRCKEPVPFSAGRCYLHGGKGSGRPIKTGKYSRLLSRNFEALYEEFRNDPNIVDLRDEIAILRALVVELERKRDLGKGPGKKAADVELVGQIRETVREVTNVIDKFVKVQATYFSLEALHVSITQMVNILKSKVDVCPHCKEPLDSLLAEVCAALQGIKVYGANKPSELQAGEYSQVD